MRYGKISCKFVAFLCVVAIAGCSDSNNSSGTVSFSLMDRPVDGVTELHVTIDEVWIKPQGSGPAIELPMTSTPLTVDLLSLTDENAATLVHEAPVPVGSYNWIEFKIDDSMGMSYAMTLAGLETPVDIDVPSDRIRLVSGFDVAENERVGFLFDWEVNKGLTEAVGRNTYILKPAFRILRADAYGTISGKLTSATAMSAVCDGVADPMVGKVVYLFDGVVTPDDIDGKDPEPVTTVDATFDKMTSDYLYRALVPAVDEPSVYTIALTCLGDKETEGEEDLMFLSPSAVDGVVTADGVVKVFIGAPVENVDF